MENVLILGATGFIGQYLAEKLKQQVHVIGYDLNDREMGFPVVKGNFAEENRFEEVLKKNQIDTVYHLISTTVPKDNTNDIDQEVMSNVIPTLRLLEAMRKSGTKRLVFISSGGTVYGESSGDAHLTTDKRKPICGYGMQKLMIEEYLQFYNRIYGLDCRIARLSNPYGVPPNRPRVQGIIPIFMEKLLHHEPITMYGDTLRDYIHIDDAIDALVRFGEYEGIKKILNIGTGIPVRISEIICLIEKITGRQFVSVNHQQIRTCDVRESVLNITETEHELNWTPKINLEQGIARTWDEIKKKHLDFMCVT